MLQIGSKFTVCVIAQIASDTRLCLNRPLSSQTRTLNTTTSRDTVRAGPIRDVFQMLAKQSDYGVFDRIRITRVNGRLLSLPVQVALPRFVAESLGIPHRASGLSVRLLHHISGACGIFYRMPLGATVWAMGER